MNHTKPDLRPVQHLIAAGSLYPNAWKLLSAMLQDKGTKLPNWPTWCFLPMAGFYSIISQDSAQDRLPLKLVGDVARLSAIGTWRYTQGIYRFDPTTFENLCDTLVEGDIPSEVILRLPEWCIYIETPGMKWENSVLYGFYTHLEWDLNTKRIELRLLLDSEKQLLPLILHIGPWTIKESISRCISEAQRQAALNNVSVQQFPEDIITDLAERLQPLVALILYLCSDEPDVKNKKNPQLTPTRPVPKKTKRGWQMFPAEGVRFWEVGHDIGVQMRKAMSNSSGEYGQRKPHLRRAHWHGYWTGPRTDEAKRKFIYHWLPPLFVGQQENT